MVVLKWVVFLLLATKYWDRTIPLTKSLLQCGLYPDSMEPWTCFQIFISWEPMLSPSIFAVPYAISPTDTNPQAAQLTGYSSGVMKPKPLSEKNFFKVPNLQWWWNAWLHGETKRTQLSVESSLVLFSHCGGRIQQQLWILVTLQSSYSFSPS